MKIFYSLLICTVLSIVMQSSQAHCQIPCGIYDDLMRIHMMEEHVVTIEKSIKKLAEKPNQNQAIRWVMSKDSHADQLSEIVTYYFMTQRIKPSMPDYAKKLGLLHEILVASMKAKQEADLKHVKTLNDLIHAFEHAYLGEAHQH